MADAESSSTEVRNNAPQSRYEVSLEGDTVVAQCWYVAEFIDQHAGVRRPAR
jgi:hypothetical protein